MESDANTQSFWEKPGFKERYPDDYDYLTDPKARVQRTEPEGVRIDAPTEEMYRNLTPGPRESKPIAQLTDQQIVTEAREIHARFAQLSEQYNEAPADQRPEIRQEMEPLVNRERVLRQEYTGRTTQELAFDRAPEEISYSR